MEDHHERDASGFDTQGTVRRGAQGQVGWAVTDAAFLGDNVTLALHDPRDGTDYAALNHGHFGVKLHRRDKGGAWTEIAAPAYPPKPEGLERPSMAGDSPSSGRRR